jgi:glycosyltransferase involved in cell wall biosynthesis
VIIIVIVIALASFDGAMTMTIKWMRIIQLTPGTGSFYCGTCLRDNALTAELRRRGHEARMVPMYLPPILDEDSTADGEPLFYGGVNVYLQQKSALFRKLPRAVDKLFDSPKILERAASRAGSTQARDLGDLTVSTLLGEEGNQVKELNRLVAWLAVEKPDVVILSNALLVGLARRIKQATGAAVVCTLQGEDSFLDSLPEPDRQRAWDTLSDRAKDCDAFIAVSHYYGNVMRERAQLPADRVHVVYNGILLDGYTPAPNPPSQPTLGYLARMCPPKGLQTLIEAYVILRQRTSNVKLRVGGSMTKADEQFVHQLRQRLASAGITDGVEFLPNLSRDEKIAFLQSLSVLSVPATYGESFGLYLIEAWAAGVPVVQPRHAAFPELIEATRGGGLCEPNDPQALAAAIEELLSHPEQAQAMGARGRQAVVEKFSVERMADGVLRVLQQV